MAELGTGELVSIVSLVATVGGLGAAWGRASAMAAAHAKELAAIRTELAGAVAELKASNAGTGRRLGGLQTAIAVLASRSDLVERLAPFLDGAGSRRQTTPGVLASLGADESGGHGG